MILTQEVLHSFKTKGDKVGSMAIKLDMAKAYDRLEWSFIEAVFLKFGFSEQFTGLIMQCVTSFFVLINEGPMGKIHPTRRIGQGDSLSPFIFISCSKVLS